MPSPLHLQVQSRIMSAIERGEYAAGERLPAEPELQKMFAVSRATIRKAMEDLSANGVVLKLQGLGTYVCDRLQEGQSARLRGYIDDVLVSDELLEFDIIEARELTPDDDIQKCFLKEDRGVATRYHKVIIRNKLPFMIGTSYIPLSIAPSNEVTHVPPGEQLTLNRLRANGHSIQRGQQTLGSKIATADDARLLQISEGVSLLASRRIYYDRTNRPLIVVDCAFHPKNYSLVVDLVPKAGGRFVSSR